MKALLIISICGLLISGCGNKGPVSSGSGDKVDGSEEEIKQDLSDFEYSVEADLVSITKGKGAGQVIIPAEIEEAQVYEIANNAFFRNIQMTSVIIPDSIKVIGNSAFAGCIGLTSVTIPANVASIGSSAFSGCINLKEVKFLGDAPQETKYMFKDAPATLYYVPGNKGWDKPYAGKTRKPIQ